MKIAELSIKGKINFCVKIPMKNNKYLVLQDKNVEKRFGIAMQRFKITEVNNEMQIGFCNVLH